PLPTPPPCSSSSIFSFPCSCDPRALHSFPTRRSSDLPPQPARFCFLFDEKVQLDGERGEYLFFGSPRFTQILHSAQKKGRFVRLDRKSTRLNSSYVKISYAVFCLKKKKNTSLPCNE